MRSLRRFADNIEQVIIHGSKIDVIDFSYREPS